MSSLVLEVRVDLPSAMASRLSPTCRLMHRELISHSMPRGCRGDSWSAGRPEKEMMVIIIPIIKKTK